jgi:hypothetical protein
MPIAVVERLAKDMIQVQIASRMNSQLGRMSVLYPSHIMSVKQSSSKIYNRRPVQRAGN